MQYRLCLFRLLFIHTSKARRIQLTASLILMIAGAFFESISITAALPLLSLLSNGSTSINAIKLPVLSSLIGQESYTLQIYAGASLLAAATLLSSGIRATNLWLSGKLAAAVGSDISNKVYTNCLFRPLAFHLECNSADLVAIILNQSGGVVVTINSLMQMLTSILVAVSICITLVYVDTTAAVVALLVLGISYFAISVYNRDRLRENSDSISRMGKLHIKILQESFDAVRPIILDRRQSLYSKMYEQVDRPMRLLQAENGFITSYPRFLMEAVGVITITAVVIYLTINNNTTLILPVIGILALGTQKLLPAVQQVYAHWCQINSCSAAILDTCGLIDLNSDTAGKSQDRKTSRRPKWENIILDNVGHTYPRRKTPAIQNVSLKISKGEKIGLIGPSGSGKTTLLDILSGLLEPSMGSITIYNNDLNESGVPRDRFDWYSIVSYVPQHIVLLDDTIESNIAFGIPQEDVDHELLRYVCELSILEGLIKSMPKGIKSTVGQNGARLSGGQRQRIGIARALYKNSEIIIFDEATSALDEYTESTIMKNLQGFSANLTLVFVSHRPLTLQFCDRLIKVENGRIV